MAPERPRLTTNQKRHLRELNEVGPYWRPQNSGEWAVARALERRGLVQRNVSRGEPDYELTDAGRAAWAELSGVSRGS